MPEELAAALRECSEAKRSVRALGKASKDRMGGPVPKTDVSIATTALSRVLIFEPRDLTISVEAGLPYAELTRLLDRHQMTIPLDPPCADTATIGGVVATNSSGPRRRGYGTPRDVVIGMTFATIEGKLIQSGGMVVKNVAGLDMAKLMIGSFGTLAVMTSINFKLAPKPQESRTFLVSSPSLDDAMQARNRILRSVLQPVALDLLNPEASRLVGIDGWSLLVQVAGSSAVMKRYEAELPEATLIDESVWISIREIAPRWDGPVLRLSCTLDGIADAFRVWSGPMLARAGNGVCYAFAKDGDTMPAGFRGLVEWGGGASAWPNPGTDIALMQKIKNMMDPAGLLNPGRFYGRI